MLNKEKSGVFLIVSGQQRRHRWIRACDYLWFCCLVSLGLRAGGSFLLTSCEEFCLLPPQNPSATKVKVSDRSRHAGHSERTSEKTERVWATRNHILINLFILSGYVSPLSYTKKSLWHVQSVLTRTQGGKKTKHVTMKTDTFIDCSPWQRPCYVC